MRNNRKTARKSVVWIVFLVPDKSRDAGADISRIIVEDLV